MLALTKIWEIIGYMDMFQTSVVQCTDSAAVGKTRLIMVYVILSLKLYLMALEIFYGVTLC